MTIINNTRILSDHPFRHVDPLFVDALTDSWLTTSERNRTAGPKTISSCLECYCEITNQNLAFDNISSLEFGRTVHQFAEALKGDSLIKLKADYKQRLVREFRRTLHFICESRFSRVPDWLSFLDWQDLNATNLIESEISEVTLIYWSGWPIVSRKGVRFYLPLTPLLHSHGEAFTVEYYSRWRGFFAKQARLNSKITGVFANFLASEAHSWPASTFENPIKIKQCFEAFLKRFFTTANQEGRNLTSVIKDWNTFVANVDETFFQSSVWPEPFGSSIPKIKILESKGAKSHVSKNKDGIEVHNKLLTEVPLQYTDDETIEILFRKIGSDLDVVRRWAKNQAYRLRSRQKARTQHAPLGKAHTYKTLGFRPTKIDSIETADIFATFEKDGFQTNLKSDKNSIFKDLIKYELAYLLGLPTSQTLFPFMALLVIEHPKITASFLSELELFDKHGQLSGFVKTDQGYLLTGYKDRRKAKLSEQKILLTFRSAALVRQVVEITQPLRNYLKSQNDDKWRKLFLTCGMGFQYPRAGLTGAWKSDGKLLRNSVLYFNEVQDQFSKFTDLRGDSFREFALRIGLSSIRASAGVLVYLETHSVKKMAEALGHAEYSSALLGRYLPESIMSFFQTRWIRIFQRAFICEAMKDSPYLLEATDFSCMSELHRFLSNHALKDIPSHLSDPEKNNSTKTTTGETDQVLISIDRGILSTLLSLNVAVKNSPKNREVCGLARYWSDIGGLIEKEIANGSDALLKQHLSEAKEIINPSRMERLIYATTS